MARSITQSGFVALCVALWATTAATRAGAQPEEAGAEELAAARSLFGEALRDEEARRFAEALQKFQRVRAVRDTPAVEYRIGTCYEGLGQVVPAYVAYRQATALGQGDGRSADVVAASQERLAALEKTVARLTVVLPDRAPANAQVRVDDVAISPAALQEPIVLAPGPHVVTATAERATLSRSEIVLPEGAHVSLTVPLEPPSPSAPRSPSLAAARVAPSAPGTGATLEPASVSGNADHTVGWIVGAAGGALLVGSAVLLLVRGSDISRLNQACPEGHCPPDSNRSDLESTRNRALVEGPLAIALGVAGALSVGTGAYLVLSTPGGSSNAATTARAIPIFSPGAAGVALAGTFR